MIKLLKHSMSKTTKSGKKNKDRLYATVSTMKKNGRKEIIKKTQLEKFPIGSMISYITKKGTFRPGGFIIRFEDNAFVYKTKDFGKHSYRVKYAIIDKMWVGDVYKVKNDLVSLVPSTQKKTNFPVEVAGIIVYYAAKNFDIERFKGTNKYQLYQKWCKYFLEADE